MRIWAGVFILVVLSTPALADDATIGKITQLQGTAWIVSEGATTDAKIGAPIRSGDHVRTGEGSRAILKLGEGDSAVMLKADSEVAVQETPAKDWAVQLDHGGALFRVKNPEHRPNHLTVRTRSATMGVRGTTFFLEDTRKGPVFFCDCNGQVAVTDTRGGTQVFTSEHHDHPTDIAPGKGALAKRLTPTHRQASEYDHSDADGAELDQAIDSP